MLTKLGFRLHILARSVISPSILGVSAAVFDGEGRVLLVRHSYIPGWHLPGGGVDRGEHPDAAIRRELAEEVGLSGGTVRFAGLYARKAGWVSAPVAFYRVDDAVVNFRPNLEVRAISFANPSSPPPGTAAGTLRRMAELSGRADISPYW